MVTFKKLSIGEHFMWGSQEWKKVKTKMKNCCIPIHNAINIVSGEMGYIPPHKEVSPVQNEE